MAQLHGPGSAPMMDVAIKYGQVGTLQFLLAKGANANQPDSKGETPLLWAIGIAPEEMGLRILELLLRAGAVPDVKVDAEHYTTPLIEAARYGELEMIKVLLEFGAKVNATNSDGGTALHYAKNATVARLLLAAGSDLTLRMKWRDMTPADYANSDNRFDVLMVLTNAPAPTNRAATKTAP